MTGAPSLEDRIGFLCRPDTYPPGSGSVTAIETHLSWVFLTNRRAFKLKKPVRHDHVDLRSVRARERNSREEVRLNRRLAGTIYIGVVSLVADASGNLSLRKDGTPPLQSGSHVVDWLVEMERLPSDRMLDRLIRTDLLDPGQIDSLCDRLIEFYRSLPSTLITPTARTALFAREQARNSAILTRPRHGLRSPQLYRLLERVRSVLQNRPSLIAEAVSAGRIVEGHGDLRPEHVCFIGERPIIMDCLEFSRTLRQVDPYDEITFLALECTLLGADWVGPRMLARMMPHLGKPPPAEVLQFYWDYRACLRARQAIAHVQSETAPSQRHGWTALAERYISAVDLPFPDPSAMSTMTGRSGSGTVS